MPSHFCSYRRITDSQTRHDALLSIEDHESAAEAACPSTAQESATLAQLDRAPVEEIGFASRDAKGNLRVTSGMEGKLTIERDAKTGARTIPSTGRCSPGPPACT